jgi:hypothetical protein
VLMHILSDLSFRSRFGDVQRVEKLGDVFRRQPAVGAPVDFHRFGAARNCCRRFAEGLASQSQLEDSENWSVAGLFNFVVVNLFAQHRRPRSFVLAACRCFATYSRRESRLSKSCR